MAWVIRPFIGDPDLPVRFFRADAWGNAYVVVARMVGSMFSDIFTGEGMRDWRFVLGIQALVGAFVGLVIVTWVNRRK